MPQMEVDDRQIEALIAALDHPDKPTIRAATDRLIALATNSRQIRDAVVRRLSEPGHRNYWPVAYILGHLPEPSEATIRNLLDALDHREPDIRWAISLLLVQLAKRESSIIDSLIDLSRSGTANQKRMAIYGLRDSGLNDSLSLAALLDSLSDADSTVRVAAVTSLKSRADHNDLVREGLLGSYLRDADLKVRNAAAVALASFGSPCEEFTLALRQASQSDNGQARKAAAAAFELLENNKARSNR